MIRSGIIVLAANCTDVAAVLLRTVILARLLPVDQFGIAATFSILMTMIDTFQNVGLNRLVVQDARANDAHFLAVLHGAQLVVSVATAALLAALAFPLAALMDMPALGPAYLALAAVPLINAGTHLETFRIQRHGRFGPQALRTFLSQPIGLLAIAPAYWWFGDYRIALVSILAQQLAAVLLTHVAAGRRYRVGFDRSIGRTVAAFGWPLIANGLLMFLILNGDRIVVLDRFGTAALGWFSAAVMLTLTPANLIAKSLQTITLGPLAQAASDPKRFQRLYDAACSTAALVAAAMIATVLVIGGPIMALLLGAKFAPAIPFLVGLACMNGLRLFRAIPAIAAMARGDTRNPLYANVIRALGVPLALAAALVTERIAPMILVGIAAECLAAIAAGRLAQRAGVSDHHYRALLALLACCVAATIGWGYYGIYTLTVLLPSTALLLTRSLTALPRRSWPLPRPRLVRER